MPLPVKTLKNAEKMSLVGEIYDSRGERGLLLVARLLHSLIQETRELNDTASLDEVVRNQGAISAYKQVLYYIETGAESGLKDTKPSY